MWPGQRSSKVMSSPSMRGRSTRTVGPARTYLVVGLLCILLAGFLVRFRGPLATSDLGTHMGLFAVGVGLWGASVLLERRIRRQLDFRTLVGVPQLSGDPDAPLLREGIYAHMRHPRYAAVLLGITGWALMANHGAVYALTLLLFPATALLIRLEERELLARFGEAYAAYRAQVPALVPRIRRS